jgi:phytanoyl-CoA hydroxylase
MEFTSSYTKSLKDEYDQNGCVKMEGVIGHDEALALGQELQQLIEARNVDVQWSGGFVSDEERAKSKIFDMHDLHTQSANFEALRHDPRILARLAILLGGPLVYHHNKGFVKPKANGETYGGKFPPHQDYPFFPHSDDRVLAAIVYMSDITEDMGPVKVFPGSHKNGPLQTVEGAMYLDDASYPPENAVTMTGRAGDVIAFNTNTVHMSGPNKSLTDRLSWLIQVRHADTYALTDDHQSPNQGERIWG